MDDQFKIYIEQLKDGHEELFQQLLSPDFLDVHEKFLFFQQPIAVQGIFYLAEEELILCWNVKLEALISCSICNELVPVNIHLNNVYTSESLAEIKTGIYNFKEMLRELILLEIPNLAECKGHCPKRKEYSKYLAKNSDGLKETKNLPFADLDWPS